MSCVAIINTEVRYIWHMRHLHHKAIDVVRGGFHRGNNAFDAESEIKGRAGCNVRMGYRRRRTMSAREV